MSTETHLWHDEEEFIPTAEEVQEDYEEWIEENTESEPEEEEEDSVDEMEAGGTEGEPTSEETVNGEGDTVSEVPVDSETASEPNDGIAESSEVEDTVEEEVEPKYQPAMTSGDAYYFYGTPSLPVRPTEASD